MGSSGLLGFRVRGYGAYGVDSGKVLGFGFFLAGLGFRGLGFGWL